MANFYRRIIRLLLRSLIDDDDPAPVPAAQPEHEEPYNPRERFIQQLTSTLEQLTDDDNRKGIELQDWNDYKYGTLNSVAAFLPIDWNIVMGWYGRQAGV